MNQSELYFYQCLQSCFSQEQNCKGCPMYGKYDGQKCRQILKDEIRSRKLAEIRKEERED